MIVTTFFKNKSPTFFSFQNFYHKYWNTKNFIYCIGYTDEDKKKFITNTYFKNCKFKIEKINRGTIKKYMENIEILEGKTEKFEFKILMYKTISVQPVKIWDSMKGKFYRILEIDKIKDKLLLVDDDEFLYSKNIEKIRKGNNFRFHFIDYVCEENFDKYNLNWSIQGWSHTHCSYIERGEGWKTYYCGGCKMYNFNRCGWQEKTFHGGKNVQDSVVCRQFKFREPDAIDLNKRSDKELNKILEEGVCFHFISLTQKQLQIIKQKNRLSDGNWTDKNFKKNNELIKKNLRIVKNNFLSDIISERDIELLELFV